MFILICTFKLVRVCTVSIHPPPTTQMQQQEFVAVEMKIAKPGWTYPGNIGRVPSIATLWACDVSDPSLAYCADFDPSNEGDTMNALEKLLEWSKGNHPDVRVDFVVWQKDNLTATLSSHNAEMFVADWIDFLSYHAGTTGLSVRQSQEALFGLHLAHIAPGADCAQALAKEFKTTFTRSLSQKRIMEEAGKLSAVWKQWNPGS